MSPWAQPRWPIGEPGQWSDGEDVNGPVLYGRIGRRVDDLQSRQASGLCYAYWLGGGAVNTVTTGPSNLLLPTTSPVIRGGIFQSDRTVVLPTPGFYLASVMMRQFTDGSRSAAQPWTGRQFFEWRMGGDTLGKRRVPIPTNGSDSTFLMRMILPCLTQDQAELTLWGYSDAGDGRVLDAMSLLVWRVVEL